MNSLDKNFFTKEEILYIEDYYKKRTNKQLANDLRRCEKHINYFLERLRFTKVWTEEEDELLRKAYPILPISFIAQVLSRTKHSVASRAARLGIKKGETIDIHYEAKDDNDDYNLEVIRMRRDIQMIRPKVGKYYKLIRNNYKRNSISANAKILGQENIVKVLGIYRHFILLEHRNGIKESITKVDLYIKEYELEEMHNE